MTTPLSEQRFRELLDAYGADPARFPEPERRAALLLLERSETARAWLEAEREFDRQVEEALSLAVEPISPELERKLASIPARYEQKANRRGVLIRLFVPTVAWAAAACVGLLLGTGAIPVTGFGEESAELAASAAFAGEDAELVAFALGEDAGFEVWP